LKSLVCRLLSKAIGGAVSFRDVTEKKQAREALRKAEKRLRTVVGSASLILFATDKNGVFTLSKARD
jgi:PAS domain-containing protein